MPVSEKDLEYIYEVADYFRSTVNETNPEGSIRDTAEKFGLSRNKVRKILVTTGDITSEITKKAVELKGMGLPTAEIAQLLGLSTATVSTYLPYEERINNTLDPSDHAGAVRSYRADQKRIISNQARNIVEPEKAAADRLKDSEVVKRIREIVNGGFDPDQAAGKHNEQDPLEVSALTEGRERADGAKETVSGIFLYNALADRIIPERSDDNKRTAGPGYGHDGGSNGPDQEAVGLPNGVMRLHMELSCSDNEKIKETLRKYGGVRYGESISRDVLVPSDMPLYAIHYLIQRLFGWQNSHLHRFYLPDEVLEKLTEGDITIWALMAGIVFRSPFMDLEEEFWSDDYSGGSFKTWLSKKYTGPYRSECNGERFDVCLSEMSEILRMIYEDRYVYLKYLKLGDGYQRSVGYIPCDEDSPDEIVENSVRYEKMKFSDLPVELMTRSFERSGLDLLERLPVRSVMNADTGEMPSGRDILRWLRKQTDSLSIDPEKVSDDQPVPLPFTDTVIYNYDFGDDWTVMITACGDCSDLLSSKRITPGRLMNAAEKCVTAYRPVSIGSDGEMIMDDVGGIYGYADFLETINRDLTGLKPKDRKQAVDEKQDLLDWAYLVQNWKMLSPKI